MGAISEALPGAQVRPVPGLELAQLEEGTKQHLRENLHPEATVKNPVDVVATANADHYFAAVDTLLKEDGTDMVLVFFVTAPFTDIDAIALSGGSLEGYGTEDALEVVLTACGWSWYRDEAGGAYVLRN